jgi:hypothetical protein
MQRSPGRKQFAFLCFLTLVALVVAGLGAEGLRALSKQPKESGFLHKEIRDVPIKYIACAEVETHDGPFCIQRFRSTSASENQLFAIVDKPIPEGTVVELSRFVAHDSTGLMPSDAFIIRK